MFKIICFIIRLLTVSVSFFLSVASPAFAEGKIDYQKHKFAALEALKLSSVSEDIILPNSDWEDAWTDKYAGSHLAYFPYVNEAVGYNPDINDKFSSKVSICYLSTADIKTLARSSNDSDLQELAIAAAFFLWSTDAWSELYSGVDPQDILAEYRFRRVSKFSPRLAEKLVDRLVYCDGYFGEIDAVKIFFEKYLQNERVISRNANNDDWDISSQLIFIPKHFFADAAAILRGFENNQQRLAFLSGYATVAEWEIAKKKELEADKRAKQRKAQLDLLAQESFSKFDENVTEGFQNLSEKVAQSFEERLPYKNSGSFVSNLFANKSIFGETPSIDALNAFDASLQTATLGLFQSNIYRKAPRSMIARSGDFIEFGDLVCRSGIMRRDLRQFFSDHHLFTGGDYGFESVYAKKNYRITSCTRDRIYFEEPWINITHSLFLDIKNNNKRIWPKEMVLKAQDAMIIPKEWYVSHARNDGIVGNYVENGSKHDIIIPIGHVALNGQLLIPPWFNEPGDGGYIYFGDPETGSPESEVCQSVLKPIQKYLPTNQTCYITSDLGLSGALSIDGKAMSAYFGWKNIDGKRYLNYGLGVDLTKESKALNAIIYKSEVKGSKTDTKGNNIKSNWQLMPSIPRTGFGDPFQKLAKNSSNVFDVSQVQITYKPSIENNNIVIKRALELHGGLVDPSSGFPSGDIFMISVDADDSEEILEAVVKLLGNSNNQLNF